MSSIKFHDLFSLDNILQAPINNANIRYMNTDEMILKI